MAIGAKVRPVDLPPVDLDHPHQLVGVPLGFAVQMAGRAGDVSVIERKRLGAAEELPVPIVDIARVADSMEGSRFAARGLMADVAGVVNRVLEEKVFSRLPFLLRGHLCVTAAARFRFDVRVQEAERPGEGCNQDHDHQ